MPTGIFTRTTEHKKHISDAMRGKNPGNQSPHWRGDGVGYHQKHRRIWKLKGKAKKCSDCGTTKGKIEWSNKDHKYSNDPADYVSRCSRCHDKYDTEKGLR